MIIRKENEHQRNLSSFELQKNIRKNPKFLKYNNRELLRLLEGLHKHLHIKEVEGIHRQFRSTTSMPDRVKLNIRTDKTTKSLQRRKQEIINELRRRNEAVRSLPRADLTQWIQLKHQTDDSFL